MDKTTTLERAGDIALETANSLKLNEEKPKEETKDASAEEETKKVEGNKLADIEKQAQEDERILSSEEADLSQEDKKRKTEILEAKESKLTPEDKIKRVQEQSQRRIDEIKSELKEERNKRSQDSETIKKLESELEGIKKTLQPKVEEDEKARIKRAESELFNKYIEEDRNKPYADRREMSKEELDDWYVEDPVEATAWINDRSLRRSEERKALLNKDTGKEIANDFLVKQKQSFGRLVEKYPAVNPKLDMTSEEFRGKTRSEINVILKNKNEIYKVCSELAEADPKRFLESVDGPDQMIAELDKRFSKKESTGKKKVELTEEELEERLKEAREQEAVRLANLDESPSSTKGKKKLEEKSKSQLRLKQEAIAKKAGIKVDDLNKSIERREKMNLTSGSAQDDKEDNE